MRLYAFTPWSATRCPHCGVVPPRWLRFERCDDPPCLVCCGGEGAGFGWYLTGSVGMTLWQHIFRSDEELHVVYVCSNCKEAVS